MNLAETIRQHAATLYPEIVKHYRYLHQHPELSYQEENTAKYLIDFLQSEGISFRDKIGGTGILAWVKGESDDADTRRTIAMVADMDALPVQEQNNIPYKSKYEGIMHACGHDSHTATLMGVAKIAQLLRAHFSGTLLFIFQPGEEQSPGGAQLMLQDGLFRDFVPEFIIKQHAYADLPAGQIAFQSGIVMASADEVHITVKGEGGHGALPHQLNDTVLAASSILVALQQIVSRRRNPFSPMTLSFGKFIANGATNVIPSKVVLGGSLRCMDEKERQKMLQIIPQVIQSTATAYGCTCDIFMPKGYPCTLSHEDVVACTRQYAIEYAGDENVTEYPKRMTAEDFGFFTQAYPCCYYRFGVADRAGKCGKLHSPTFLIDEKALEIVTGCAAYILIKSLKKA